MTLPRKIMPTTKLLVKMLILLQMCRYPPLLVQNPLMSNLNVRFNGPMSIQENQRNPRNFKKGYRRMSRWRNLFREGNLRLQDRDQKFLKGKDSLAQIVRMFTKQKPCKSSIIQMFMYRVTSLARVDVEKYLHQKIR